MSEKLYRKEPNAGGWESKTVDEDWVVLPETYVRAEDAELKVRAWDAAVAAGALEQPKVYAQQAKDMKRLALMNKEPAWQRMAAANAELAAVMKAIEHERG